ncbi:MAG: alpha-2-macroglobulin family protein [Thermodesulfobacteriota bacterium]
MTRNMGWWRVLCLGLALACGPLAGPAGAAGAEDGPGAALTVKLMPLGEVERLTQVTARFSRPMRPLGAMEQSAADAPLKLDPSPPGAFRWLDPQTLAYLLDQPVSGATRIRLSVPAGVAALDGSRLAKAVTGAVRTPAIAVLEFFPAPGQPLGPRPRLRITLNQPVDLASLGANAFLEIDGRRLALSASELPRDPWLPPGEEHLARAYALQAAEDLPPGRDVALTLAPGILPAGGGLPTREPIRADYRSYDPLTVLKWEMNRRPDGRLDPAASLLIEFSNPVKPAEIFSRLKLTPPDASPQPPREKEPTRWVFLDLGLKPRGEYRLEIAPGAVDDYGTRMAEPLDLHLATGDLAPVFSLLGGKGVLEAGANALYPLRLRNLDLVRAAVQHLGPEAAVPALVAEQDRPWDQKPRRPEPAQGAVRRDLRFDLPPNQLALKPLDLAGLLGRLPQGGLTLIDLRAELPDHRGKPSEEIRRALVQVTDLGLCLKAGVDSGLAWVTSLSAGKPLAGVALELRDRRNRALWRGESDAQGLARLPGLAELKPAADKSRPWLGPQVFLLARLGDDFALLPAAWSNDLAYSLGEGVEYQTPEAAPPLMAHAITQLPLYQPGQSVRWVVYLRAEGEQGLAPPPPDEVTLSILDPYGRKLAETKGRPNRFGSLAGELALSPQARLGEYALTVKAGGQEIPAGGFRVASFRPPDFAVSLSPPAMALGAAPGLPLGIEARYPFGSPVAGGRAKLSVNQRFEPFAPPRLAGYAVGEAAQDEDATPRGQSLGELTASLDAQGRTVLSLPAPQPQPGRPVRVSLEATVSDPSGLAVTGRQGFLAHPAEVYLGLRGPGLATAGQPASFDLLAALSDDRPAPPLRVELSAFREYWETVRERGPGGFYHHLGQVRREKVWQGAMDLPPAGGQASFTPPEAGTYLLVAEARDAQGRANRSAAYVYAAGPGQAGWQRFDDHRLELVAQPAQAAPGQSVRVLVKNPFRAATALVSVERSGVRRQWQRAVEGPAPVIEVPIEPGDAPNVYVGVLLVRGRVAETGGEGPDLGKPQVRIGYVAVKVEPATAGLTVRVAAERADYRPGQEVRAEAVVQDAQGRPLAGQVTFLAVDERVLGAAGGREAYDPRQTFDRPRPLRVLTADGRTQVVGRRFAGQKGEDAAGGGGLGPAVRRDFHPAVFWLAQGLADERGRLAAAFKLPDSLTAYRLVAVAADQGGQFGLGQATIRARRPLQLLPALPRFAVAGDHFSARVLVQNLGETPGRAVVRLRAEGLELIGPAEQAIDLQPGQSLPLGFMVKAGRSGPAALTFAAELAGETDAARFGLDVLPAAPLITAAAAGALDAGAGPREAAVPLLLPAGSDPGRGGLTLTLAASPAAGLAAPMQTLIDYPWDCLEQRLSRAAARALRLRHGQDLGLAPAPDDGRKIQAALAAMADFQTGDGGFAFWPGLERSDLFLTAYALLATRQMQPDGADALASLRKPALDYLERTLKASRAPKPADTARRLAESLALLALAEEGRKVRPLVEAALSRAQGLAPFGLAALMRAAAASGLDGAVDGLVTQLEASAVVSAEHLHFGAVDPGGLKAALGSPLRGNAMALWSLARLRPQYPRLEALAAWVAQGLGQERGLSTQEAVFGLWALSAYLQRPGGGGPAALKASLDGQVLAEAVFDRPAQPPRSLAVGLDRLTPGRQQTLLLGAEAGRPHWSARLSHAPAQPPAAPVNAGFGLARLLRAPQAGPALGDQVECLLTLLVPETRHHVLLNDPYPAGLEPIGASLGRPPAGQDPPAWDPWLWRELRADGLVLYAPVLGPGVYTFRYRLRAVAPGGFIHRSATVEEMYAPEVMGGSGAGRLEVR